ncbi:hypothetical protein DVH05_006599 [Phytophthora capsici]|nr:hypothetical protein DVH05_006599 [Phytophthora capsici]
MKSDERNSVTLKRKPVSAYQYYQKLVQDFDALEREMESHRAEQSDLEGQLARAKAKIQASKAENQRDQQLQWERERDRQLELFVQQRAAFDSLCAQTEELEDQELRLQAEMEVLHEKQQEVNDTEARRIRQLVHERTSLLEDELAKGKADLDYIAHVVSGQELKQEKHKKTLVSVEKIVQDVQERRRREFKASEENFQARMQSFQREKESLAKKANELQVTKRKALEILSENQQRTIKGFFDPVKKEEHLSLNFGEILHSLNQSGAQVEQIQTERNSSRDFVADLEEARAILEKGNRRIEAIQKNLDNRKAEAKKLGVISPDTGYDGVWGIESYPPHQYETVYYIRSLVFSWMDMAVAETAAQPTKELLQVEINRWRIRHVKMKHDRDRERNLSLATQILSTLIRDVTIEIAEDIRMEFESNSQQVRGAIASALKSLFFPISNKLESKKTPVKPVDSVRSSLFESSFKHMRGLRYRHNDSNPTTLLHQHLLPKQRTPATVTSQTAKSPLKKVFGLFTVSRSEAKERVQLPSSTGIISQPVSVEMISFIPPDATSPSPSQ